MEGIGRGELKSVRIIEVDSISEEKELKVQNKKSGKSAG